MQRDDPVCYPQLEAIAALVEELTDPTKWRWQHATDRRSAASSVLNRMVKLGIIEGRKHPNTWSNACDVFRVAGRIFGRTDNVDDSLFDG